MADPSDGLSRNGSKPPGNAGCILGGVAVACGLGFFGYCYHAWQETGDRMEREAIQERTAAETRYAKAVSDLRAKPPRVLDDIVRVAGDPFDCHPSDDPADGLQECSWGFSPTAHHLYSWTRGSHLGATVVRYQAKP
jgi:hypothetical protein